jgi:acyl-CoA thioester hydrolase
VKPAIEPRLLAGYPLQIREQLRYADTDRQGHINNAVFATFCESGRVAFLYDPACPLAAKGSQFVIAELTIRFLGELNWPGEAVIGTGVSRIGRSSLTLVQGIFAGDECKATAESVIVLIDEETRRPTPLQRAALDALTALKMPNRAG